MEGAEIGIEDLGEDLVGRIVALAPREAHAVCRRWCDAARRSVRALRLELPTHASRAAALAGFALETLDLRVKVLKRRTPALEIALPGVASVLASLTALRSLSAEFVFGDTPSTAPLATALAGLEALTFLNIASCFAPDWGLLAQLTALEDLNANVCGHLGRGPLQPSPLKHLTLLRRLDIGGCSAVMDWGAGGAAILAGLPHLEQLWMGNCGERGFAALLAAAKAMWPAPWPALRVLDLWGAYLPGGDTAALAELWACWGGPCPLRRLSLSSVEAVPRAPALALMAERCQSLECLELLDWLWCPADLAALSSLSALTSLEADVFNVDYEEGDFSGPAELAAAVARLPATLVRLSVGDDFWDDEEELAEAACALLEEARPGLQVCFELNDEM
eukprot:scaffold16.g111.t1